MDQHEKAGRFPPGTGMLEDAKNNFVFDPKNCPDDWPQLDRYAVWEKRWERWPRFLEQLNPIL